MIWPGSAIAEAEILVLRHQPAVPHRQPASTALAVARNRPYLRPPTISDDEAV
jgi:hypothetical protein